MACGRLLPEEWKQTIQPVYSIVPAGQVKISRGSSYYEVWIYKIYKVQSSICLIRTNLSQAGSAEIQGSAEIFSCKGERHITFGPHY